MVINYDPRLIDLAKQFRALAPVGCITTITETYLREDRRNKPELVISAFSEGSYANGGKRVRSEEFHDGDVDIRIDWYEGKEEAANE